MPAGSAATRAARRPINVLMLIATAVGLLFGLTAPDVSPVVGAAFGATGATAAGLNGDDANPGTNANANADPDDDDGDGDGGMRRRGGGAR